MRRTVARATAGAALASALIWTPVLQASADGETCNGLPATLVVTAARGVAEGTAGDDVIVAHPTSGSTGEVPPGVTNLEVFGEGGNDTICVVGAYALAYGGPGDDTLLITRGTAGLLDGGPGNDVLRGSSRGDVLVGDSGNDRLTAGKGNDLVAEGTGTPGDDVVNTGLGRLDKMSFVDVDHGITLDLPTGQNTGFGTDVITGVESWAGSGFDDTMIGTPQDDRLDAGPGGHDHLVGGDGNDKLSAFANQEVATIEGGAGDDRILVRDGTISAGDGSDRVRGLDGVHVDLGPGDDIARIDNYGDAPTTNTEVVGGSGNDVLKVEPLTGGPPDTYRGGTGTDFLWVLLGGLHNRFDFRSGVASTEQTDNWFRFGGVESFRGTRQRDTIIGGPEADNFYGAPGSDVLRGGGGPDVLDGGANRDVAVGGNGQDACAAEITRSCERPVS